ncbi:MAG: hypothetical protein O7D91_11425 [Planctomycetota bacterium]|nr:hypothetical protein [Planctomycetota bacterium]
MRSIISGLETLALKIRGQTADHGGPHTPRRGIEHEIAFVSEQLDRSRESHKKHLDSIRRVEFETEVALTNLGPYEFDRQQKLKTKLFKLHKERRDRIDVHHKDMVSLHDRLFSLIGQRAHLQ